MPRELIPVADCVSVAGADGRVFHDYYDLDRLRAHMLALAPGDRAAIDHYLRGVELCTHHDLLAALMFGGTLGMLASLPHVWRLRAYMKPTMGQYAERFTDPLLRSAFPLLVYSNPDVPVFVHLIRHAYGLHGNIAWPAGGALAFARSMADRYTELGGAVQYGHKVVEILTEGDRAVGVRLDDGSELRADYVVSNADGRRTIMELLGGRFIDDRIRGYCAEPDDETNWAGHVFLGVNRDLSEEPSSLVMLLDEPVEIAGHLCHSLEMQIYGFDPAMAPAGKGVIKVELVSRYSYWQELAKDKARYEAEKARVADQVIDLLERHFPGLRAQVEAIDVPTLLTWERFMGGTHGFANMPKKPFDFQQSVTGKGMQLTLPGLRHFYFAGAWATSAGALFMNALSGRKAVEAICKATGKRFEAP